MTLGAFKPRRRAGYAVVLAAAFVATWIASGPWSEPSKSASHAGSDAVAEGSANALPTAERASWQMLVMAEWRGQIEPCQCRRTDLGNAASQLGELASLRARSATSSVVYAGNVLGTIPAGESSSIAVRAASLRRDLGRAVLEAARPDAIVPGAADWHDEAGIAALGRDHRLICTNATFDGPLDEILLSGDAISVRVRGFVVARSGNARFSNAAAALAASSGQAPPSGGPRILEVVVLCVDAESAESELLAAVRESDTHAVLVVAGVFDEKMWHALEREASVGDRLLVRTEALGQQWCRFDADVRVQAAATGSWEPRSKLSYLQRLRSSLRPEDNESPFAHELDVRIEAGRHRVVACDLYEMEFVPITNASERDPALAESIAQYRAAVRSMVDEERAHSATRTSPYQGTLGCIKCHEAIGHQWAATAHAHAFQTLISAGRQADPQCLACHTTGFGLPGGFVAADLLPDLANVQCEGCHGPGGNHPIGGARTIGSPRDACHKCHDPLNSPQFRLDQYLPRVACRAVHEPPAPPK